MGLGLAIKYIIIGAIAVFAAIGAIITFIIRAKKKGGIKKFLASKGIDYERLLQAHESGHNVAVSTLQQKIHLVLYSKTKKAYQHKTFDFNQVEKFEIFGEGVMVMRITKDNVYDSGHSYGNSGFIAVKVFIEGIQLPYYMKLDYISENDNTTLINEVGLWISTFNEIIGGNK